MPYTTVVSEEGLVAAAKSCFCVSLTTNLVMDKF